MNDKIENEINPEQANICKVIRTFADRIELTIGKSYTVDKDVMSEFWTKELLKDNPTLTGLQVKESAKNVLKHTVLELPSLMQFKVIGRIEIIEETKRSAISVEEWQEQNA